MFAADTKRAAPCRLKSGAKVALADSPSGVEGRTAPTVAMRPSISLPTLSVCQEARSDARLHLFPQWHRWKAVGSDFGGTTNLRSQDSRSRVRTRSGRPWTCLIPESRKPSGRDLFRPEGEDSGRGGQMRPRASWAFRSIFARISGFYSLKAISVDGSPSKASGMSWPASVSSNSSGYSAGCRCRSRMYSE